MVIYRANSLSAKFKMEISISSKKIAIILTIVALCLTIANILVQFSIYFLGHDYLLGIVPLFNFYAEANIPTWFSSTILLTSSILLATIAYSSKINGAGNVRYWGGLSVIFLFLSVDELAQLHEKMSKILRLAVNPEGIFHSPWVIAGAIFVIIFVLVYLRFFFNLPKKIKYLFFIAGTLFIGGALGFELIENIYVDTYGTDVFFAIMVTIEELLEMAGIILFIYALFLYMSSHVENLIVNID